MIFKFNRHGVRFCFALIGGVCVSVPLFRCSSVRASAVDIDYQLTYEQTLALYGTSIPVVYYDAVNQLSTQKIAQFIGYTDQFGSNNSFADIKWYSVENNSWYSPGGLVYMTTFPAGEFISSLDSSHANIYLSHSVDMQGLTRYRQNIFFQIANNSSGSGGSSDTVYQTSFGAIPQYSAYRGANRYSVVGLWPSYTYTQSDTVNENYLHTMSGIISDISNNSATFSISGSSVSLRNCGVSSISGRNINGTSYFDTDAMFFIVGCPILTGENPEIVTTTVTTTTATTSTEVSGTGNVNVNVDIDLTPIETQLNTIISNQNREYTSISGIEQWTRHSYEILDGMYETQTEQLNTIITQLNNIYNKMVDDGIVVPTLNNAPDIAIDSAVDSRVQSELEDFSFPDVDQELDTEAAANVAGVIGSFRSWIPARMIAIYSTALVLSLVVWFLFRGRG